MQSSQDLLAEQALKQQSKDNSNVRFVCISDTHCEAHLLELPPGDVLIHAGDFSMLGKPSEINQFIEFLQKQCSGFKYKVVIAGNHDLTMDSENYDKTHKYKFKMAKQNFNITALKEELKQNCIYLENSTVNLFGYNIYGSPFTPHFRDWAFMLPNAQMEQHWKLIPSNTDILVTHGPPYQILDQCSKDKHVGCPHLAAQISQRIKPLYHVFGHIHETYGVQKVGATTYINATSVDENYNIVNKPVVFELPKRE